MISAMIIVIVMMVVAVMTAWCRYGVGFTGLFTGPCEAPHRAVDRGRTKH